MTDPHAGPGSGACRLRRHHNPKAVILMATAPVTDPCPICSEVLRFTVCTNRNGKHSVGLHCPQDGRQFRGFSNHKPFVEDAISHMAAAEEALCRHATVGLRERRPSKTDRGHGRGGNDLAAPAVGH